MPPRGPDGRFVREEGFFNLINNQNIPKIKKNQKKLYFLIIK